MKNKLSVIILATLALMGLVGLSTVQAQIIYQDTFNRTGSLNGTAPDAVDTASAKWTSASASTNGSVAVASSVQSFLAFTPTAGHIYTLSVNLTDTSGDWVALGFSSGANAANAWNSSANNPGPWFLMKSDGTLQGFGGPNTANEHDFGTGIQGGLYTITLNTASTAWTFTFAGSGITSTTYTLSTNPTITEVGFGTANGASVTVDNFTLSQVAAPEPSTYALLGLGSLALLIVGHRRNRLQA